MRTEKIKNLVIVGLCLIIVVMAIAMMSDKYQVFHSNLSENELAYMCKILDENAISYKQKNNQIHVKGNQLKKADNLLNGYTSYDTSEEARKESIYQLMSQEISKAIEGMEEVQKADVSLMISENAGNKVACILTLENDNLLDETQINSLVTFINGSVENLKREDIIVMDSDFNVLFSEAQE